MVGAWGKDLGAALGAESSLQMTANMGMGTQVLQPQGTESAKNKDELGSGFFH